MIDTLQYITSPNPLDSLWNFTVNYFLQWSILLVAFVSLFLIETIKWFSEDTKYQFELNKKLYGVVSFVLIMAVDLYLNPIPDYKLIIMIILLHVCPIFVIYNVFLKQIFEAFRKFLARKIKEWTGE